MKPASATIWFRDASLKPFSRNSFFQLRGSSFGFPHVPLPSSKYTASIYYWYIITEHIGFVNGSDTFYTKHIYLCLEDSRYSFAHRREFIQPYMESPAKCLRHFAGKALKTAAMADFLTCPSSHPFYHRKIPFATQMVHRSAACARQSLTASRMASLVNVADETASTSQVCASTIWEGISSIARSEIFTVSL